MKWRLKKSATFQKKNFPIQFVFIVVLSDEVYDFLSFDGRKHVPFASVGDNWRRTVSIYTPNQQIVSLNTQLFILDKIYLELVLRIVEESCLVPRGGSQDGVLDLKVSSKWEVLYQIRSSIVQILQLRSPWQIAQPKIRKVLFK